MPSKFEHHEGWLLVQFEDDGSVWAVPGFTANMNPPNSLHLNPTPLRSKLFIYGCETGYPMTHSTYAGELEARRAVLLCGAGSLDAAGRIFDACCLYAHYITEGFYDIEEEDIRALSFIDMVTDSNRVRLITSTEESAYATLIEAILVNDEQRNQRLAMPRAASRNEEKECSDSDETCFELPGDESTCEDLNIRMCSSPFQESAQHPLRDSPQDELAKLSSPSQECGQRWPLESQDGSEKGSSHAGDGNTSFEQCGQRWPCEEDGSAKCSSRSREVDDSLEQCGQRCTWELSPKNSSPAPNQSFQYDCSDSDKTDFEVPT